MRHISVLATALSLLLMSGAVQAVAAPLQITKTAAPVGNLTNLAPKPVPGAIVDYTILVKNPNTLTVARNIVITDRATNVALPANAEYYVGNLDGAGPVVFSDGSLLGLGLFGSNLSYTFTSLSSTTDSVAFSDDGGVTFTYSPIANSEGYDPRVTHIRVSPSGNFAVLSGFSLRIRMRIK